MKSAIRFRDIVLSRWVLAFGLTVAMTPGIANTQADVSMPELRLQLLRMQEEDQKARTEPVGEDLDAVDARHLQVLKDIIARHGWPTFSMVGHDGAFAAWLIAQHADADPDFQLRVLAMIEALVKTGEAAPQAAAYLYDRTHRPQRYGTQGSCDADGRWQAREIEDPAHLNERRHSVGLGPFEEYGREATDAACPK